MTTVTPVQTTSPIAPLNPTQEIPQNKHLGINEGVNPPLEATSPESQLKSSQFAALARREKMIRHQARALEAEKQSLKAKEVEIEQSINSRWKERLSQNTWDTLLEAGITPEQVTHLMLNQPRPEDVQYRNLEKEIRELKQSQQQSLEQYQKQQSENYEQIKKQMGQEISLLVKDDPQFEAIRHYGDHGKKEVLNLIEQVFNQGIPGVYQAGYVMPIDEAAQEVENYLIGELERSYKNIKKLQPRLAPPEQPGQKQFNNQKQPYQTLSNQTIPTAKPLSDRERKQRAILAFQGKL